MFLTNCCHQLFLPGHSNFQVYNNTYLISIFHSRLASQAADALLNICSQCQSHMTPHFQGLVHILSSLDSFQLKPAAAIGLIKGAALLICNMPHEKYCTVL